MLTFDSYGNLDESILKADGKNEKKSINYKKIKNSLEEIDTIFGSKKRLLFKSLNEELFRELKEFFLYKILKNPSIHRTLLIVGSLQHGKTTFIHSLLNNEEIEFCNVFLRNDEQSIKISLNLTPYSILFTNTSSSNLLFINVLDSPGHCNLIDDIDSGIRLSDGSILLIDVLEGITIISKKILKFIAYCKSKLYIMISRIDKLILELHIPSNDFANRIMSIVGIIESHYNLEKHDIASRIGFLSAIYGCFFNLNTINQLYFQKIDRTIFFGLNRWLFSDKSILIGKNIIILSNLYHSSISCFDYFIITPIYKIFNYCISENPKKIYKIAKKYGIYLQKIINQSNFRIIVRKIMYKIFNYKESIVKSIFEFFESSSNSTNKMFNFLFYNSFEVIVNKKINELIQKNKREGFLKQNLAIFTRSFPLTNNSKFFSTGRVLIGSFRGNEKYSLKRTDSNIKPISLDTQYIIQASIKKNIKISYIGNIINIENNYDGFNDNIYVLGQDENLIRRVKIRNRHSLNKPYFKVSIYPYYNRDLSRLVSAFKKSSIIYHMVSIKVQESGEITVASPGEFISNLLLKDICDFYALAFIKVSDPFTSVCEVAHEPSLIKCNGKSNTINFFIQLISGPVESNTLITKISNVSNDSSKDIIKKFIEHNVWKIDPNFNLWSYIIEKESLNYLISEISDNKPITYIEKSIKKSIINGFILTCKNGPLCKESLAWTKFAITSLRIPNNIVLSTNFEIIEVTRRVAISAFILSSPRLIEPNYFAQISTPFETLKVVFNLLKNRRASLVKDYPLEGSPKYIIEALLPIIESIGIEIDLRYHTQGQSTISIIFENWTHIPGNPLDNDKINQEKVSYAANPSLFVMQKLRKKKGLKPYISLNKVFDEALILRLLVK